MRSGRLGVCELLAERRQELRFRVPLTHSCQFAISPRNPSADLSSRSLQIENCFSVHLGVGTAGKCSPASHFFTSPDLILLHRIYTIALYVNYPIKSHHFYLNCVERGPLPPAWKCGSASRFR